MNTYTKCPIQNHTPTQYRILVQHSFTRTETRVTDDLFSLSEERDNRVPSTEPLAGIRLGSGKYILSPYFSYFCCSKNYFNYFISVFILRNLRYKYL